MLKRNETDRFPCFLHLVSSLREFSYRALCSPPYVYPFSYSDLEEATGVEEPVLWEAPLKGTVHPEAHQVKELI